MPTEAALELVSAATSALAGLGFTTSMAGACAGVAAGACAARVGSGSTGFVSTAVGDAGATVRDTQAAAMRTNGKTKVLERLTFMASTTLPAGARIR
jgi:hypothetical protein